MFLPKSTPVDPETGSKYASVMESSEGKLSRRLIKDNNLETVFTDWSSKLGMHIHEVVEDYKSERHYFRQQDKERIAMDAIRRSIKDLGFPEDVIHRLGRAVFSELVGWGEIPQENISELLETTSAIFKRPDNAIPAMDYWEKYFSENPQLRPANVHYYEGSPTQAVFALLQENEIGGADVSEEEGSLLGFEDNHVTDMSADPRANQGREILLDKANRRIDEIFGRPDGSQGEFNAAQFTRDL